MPDKILNVDLTKLRQDFDRAAPYRHIVIDRAINQNLLRLANSEFDDLLLKDKLWGKYSHYNENKKTIVDTQLMAPFLKDLIYYFHSNQFIRTLEVTTGYDGLIADSQMEGGGLSVTENSGFLNLHTDFSHHPHHKTWRRCLNLLLFFNLSWEKDYGGALELWKKESKQPVKVIKPKFNRLVIFETNQHTIHGYPDKLKLPKNVFRKSLNLYFYKIDKENPRRRYTKYVSRPGDTLLKKLFISWESKAITLYGVAKLRFGISDKLIISIFGYINNAINKAKEI